MRKERIVLEDGIDRTLIWLGESDISVTKGDCSLGWLFKAGDHSQSGGLTAT
jgi:hypothetical protein